MISFERMIVAEEVEKGDFEEWCEVRAKVHADPDFHERSCRAETFGQGLAKGSSDGIAIFRNRFRRVSGIAIFHGGPGEGEDSAMFRRLPEMGTDPGSNATAEGPERKLT